jgi:hypothetical protein
LFAGVAGTLDSSEFSLAFMSVFPSATFADRPNSEYHRRSLPLKTREIPRFSRLEWPRLHAFSDYAVFACTSPVAVQSMLPSPCQDKIGPKE